MVEEKIIATKHHCYIEQNYRNRHQVQWHASFLKAFKEDRPYLKTDTEDEQNKSEILKKGKQFFVSREAKMSGKDACKKHPCDTKCYTTEFYFS